MSDYQYPGLREFLEKAARVRARATRAEKLSRWSKPPSQTETEKCERAVRMIRQAIDADIELSAMNISVYAKGSFANRTNIPSDSDVDVAVVANGYHFNEYPAGKSAGDAGLVLSDYTFAQFKTSVQKAIVNKFGSAEVEEGKKSIKVRSNSCRVDADIVPHFLHRRYNANMKYIEGVALLDSSGEEVRNWPQQDYDNGVAKNDRTGKKFKGLARVLKSLKSEMKDAGFTTADNAPSYLLACLAWNVPDDVYDEDDFEVVVLNVVDYLIEQTANASNVGEWGEVNELKYLFRQSQPWKLDQTHQFLKELKTFLGTL
jgi:hypothetical protein